MNPDVGLQLPVENGKESFRLSDPQRVQGMRTNEPVMERENPSSGYRKRESDRTVGHRTPNRVADSPWQRWSSSLPPRRSTEIAAEPRLRYQTRSGGRLDPFVFDQHKSIPEHGAHVPRMYPVRGTALTSGRQPDPSGIAPCKLDRCPSVDGRFG